MTKRAGRVQEFNVAIEALVRSAYDVLARIDLPTVASFLSHWPKRIASCREIAPRGLPVLAWMESLPQLAVDTTHELVTRLVEAADRLHWAQTYSSSDFGDAFLQRYGWTELIGLRGPVASDEIAAGVLLLAPDIEYPLHAHEAEELYLPLAGTAQWKRADNEWVARVPGEVIHHPPWIAHAMRTEREPLLALYVWRGGDLTQKSTIV